MAFSIKAIDYQTFSSGEYTRIPPSSLTVRFPSRDDMNESPNWIENHRRRKICESPIRFHYGRDSSNILKLENMYVTHCETNNIYKDLLLCGWFPESLHDLFLEASKAYFPMDLSKTNYHRASQGSLVADVSKIKLTGKPDAWWKFLDNNDSIGFFDDKTSVFQTFDSSKFWRETKQGFWATLFVRFYCQAITVNNEPPDEKPTRTLRLEIVRGFVTSLDTENKIRPPFHEEMGMLMPTDGDIPSQGMVDIMKKYTNPDPVTMG